MTISVIVSHIMIENGTLLDILRLAIGAIILLYASYTDIKTRRASNMLWVIMGSGGAILLIIQYFFIGIDNIIYLAFIPIMIGLIYVFFQLRLIFGGADAKALMALTILVPLEPAIQQFPIWKTIMIPFPFIIFLNSLIIFLFIPLGLFLFNITRRNIKFPNCFLGYRMSVRKAKEKFVWPMEKIVDGKRKFVYMPKNFDVEEELKEFEKQGIKEIWVTPKIPFMIPLLVGFIVSFIIGNIFFHILNPAM